MIVFFGIKIYVTCTLMVCCVHTVFLFSFFAQTIGVCKQQTIVQTKRYTIISQINLRLFPPVCLRIKTADSNKKRMYEAKAC